MANENDWGDGVLNNTIGWGQGADNNTIGWGSVYGESEAGLTALEGAGGGTIPVISGVPTISAESQVGETITATAASVTGDPTPTTSWTWQRSADGSTGWANIAGATSITYTLVAADDANYVRAVQTETNASGSDSANSLASAQISDFSFGNALSFDGVNDYVSIGSPVSISAEATVNMWVKFSDLNTRLISDTSNTAVIWTPSSTSVRVYCGGNFQDFVVPAMSLGTWYMITATRNAANGWRVYLNGTESTSGLQVRSGTFNVNRLGNLGSVYSDIVLDEVSILDGTTASDIQIASLYNSGNGANANSVLGSTSLYYRLNGSGTDITATDSSGNSNTGTLNNFTGTYWVEHIVAPVFAFSNALSFDGVNDNVSFTAVSKPALTNGFCFGFWVNFSSTPNFEYILGDSTNANQWFRWSNSTSATFRSRATGSATTTFSFPAISTSTWYYIAVSLNGGVNEMWINGTKYTGDTDNYDNENISFNTIGWRGLSEYAQFILDELFVKTESSLIQQNVDDLYNGGLGQFATDVITDPDIYYRLNGSGTDTTAIDDSGNSNTGTLNNFTGTYWVEHIVLDPDAAAYITAAGITDPTEQVAVNQLVLDLKGTGSTTNNTDIWTGLDAIYPTSPTSLSAAEYNLKDPATYQITWYNSPTHSSAGVAFDGLDQYGDTGYAPTDGLQNDHSFGANFSVYAGGNGTLIGARTISPNYYNAITQYNNRIYYGLNSASGSSRSGGITPAHYIVNRDSSLVTLFRDTVDYGRVTAASTGQSTYTYFLGAQNYNGPASFLGSGTMNFSHIGASLTANQVTDLYDAITTYNTAVR